MMAAPPGPRSRFTVSSSRKVEHTYVPVKVLSVSATLYNRQGTDWQAKGFGAVTAKFYEDQKCVCVRVAEDETTANPLLFLQVTRELELTRSGDKDIVWKDSSGSEHRLGFENVAGRDNIWTKVKKAHDLSMLIEDLDGLAMWYANFASEPNVPWNKFFDTYQKNQNKVFKESEDSLKALLITPDQGDVAAGEFNNFLLWFGPLPNSYDKWKAVTSLSYFHGNVAREEAEEALRGKPEKSFLLRFSEPGFFAVSYVGATDQSENLLAAVRETAIYHFRIENGGVAGFAMMTAEEEVQYEQSIERIIARQSDLLSLNIAVEQLPFERPTQAPAPTTIAPVVPVQPTVATKARAAPETIEFLADGWAAALLVHCKSDEEEVVLGAARVIVAWVEVDANKLPFAEGGGLPLIAALVDSPRTDPAVERLAVRALCALVNNAKIKMMIVQQALPALYSFAASQDEQIQQYAAFIFANIVLNDAQIQQILLEKDCLSALNTLAKAKSAYVQANVAWVFGNLAQHENNKRPILLGGLQALFKLAQSENEKVKKYAFDALGCLGIVDGDDVGKLVAQVKQSLDPKPVWEIEYSQIEDLQLVDSGGYGNVYLGKYLHMKVAVKLLKKSQLRDLEAFKIEIAMMSKLRHPNIVLFLGATTSPLTIVTEYMSRKSMFDVIHDQTVEFSSRLVLKMARDAALGMSYLHQLNIIHRDLKSLNLLMDEAFNVKIADFGLSRVISIDTTMTPHGTYAWRPPEMFRSEPYDQKVDVYSYGIVLWEMYTRDIPFDGMAYEDIKRAVLGQQRPALPPTHDPVLEEMVGLMQACWQNDPRQRPTFDDICVGLEEVDKLVNSATSSH